MGKDKPPAAGSSKTESAHGFRFSLAGRAFLKEYFHNRNNSPKKKERKEILAHLMELGDTGASDSSLVNWFTSTRQKERRNSSLLPPTFAPEPEPDEKKWLDARHKSLWPSIKRESFAGLEELYTEHLAQEGTSEPPYDLWAEGLEAKPEHIRMWCKFKIRQSAQQSRPGAATTAGTTSQIAKEHSQLPTPGNSTSPEPFSLVARPPLSPDAVKDEPPVSPVVETTRICPPPKGPKEKSSFGLHAAIESAFSAPSQPPAHSIQLPEPPSASTQTNHQRKSSSRSSSRTIHVVSPPTPPSVSTNNTTAPTSPSLPPTSITPTPQEPEHSPPPSDHDAPVPFSPKEPTPEPPAQPERDVARERSNLVTGIAAKFDELGVVFNSAHGLSQLAGSIQVISRRHQQFLGDVAIGRFAHSRLTRVHLPGRQVENPMPEFNPLQVLADRQRSSKEKEKEEEEGSDMDVD